MSSHSHVGALYDRPIEFRYGALDSSGRTHTGTLDLKWARPNGLGGGGHGVQVAEVWLRQLSTQSEVKPQL